MLTYDDLVDFLEKKMSMSHVYQPVLIRSLVEAGGATTVRQLALSFLSQDESQLLYYERRIKEMPVRVLSRHGVVERQGELIVLATKPLTLVQKARVRMICERRLQEYVQRRGLSIWDHRMLEDDPVPDSLRYIVLARSGGRCALCGATKKERPLDVDHIVPRSRGGKNTIENLQVLCSKCNRSKRDKDATDFRDDLPGDEPDPDCPFCDGERASGAVEVNGSAYATPDEYPVTRGHLLVIPRRHTDDFFTMTARERADAEDLLRLLRNKIALADASVVGFNIGLNCGAAAGQTVMHAHYHLIPRREGDTQNPRGGVRGVIPHRMSY
jgi:ATP adenylyltransferase